MKPRVAITKEYRSIVFVILFYSGFWDAAIHAISATVEARDPYKAGHQRRVAELARAIATEMGL